MITEKEQNATLLSPVKKDYYQIWNELLETASKLSERWDPTSTNEADPGIVLLKVLTAVSDKLNYNIDKNTLEAFMPSAAQEESMRKLCDILGYSMKYYRSATTTALISYVGDVDNIPTSGIFFPKYTNLKSEDNEISYLTLEAFTLDANKSSAEVSVIEGTLQQCATETDNIITTTLLDDNYRYSLPESQIAENGIFVYNLLKNTETKWEQVSNLNTVASGQKVYKFGYNSATGMPYLQFPEDINNIIGDGLYIYYIRTNGINGNISTRKLSTFEKPELWSDSNYKDYYSVLTTDMFSIVNTSAATNGTNKESIDQAYNNYKKIIGTFDTLVTCRDYINKIYQLTVSENDTTPLVSNIVVSDIKDDINHAITLCTFNDYGIKYSSKALETEVIKTAETTSGETVLIKAAEPQITNFDLILYPFKTVTGLNTKSEYDNSFKYNSDNINEIYAEIEDYKTLSHNLILPNDDDISCIKNYLRLNARITTVSKVNSVEAKEILTVIKTAIYKQFNARNLDFSEEIPYDDILECIEQADERIKNVSLDEPELYTVFTLVDGTEYTTGSIYGINSYNNTNEKITDGIFKTDYSNIIGKTNTNYYNADKYGTNIVKNIINTKTIYNKLALRNILAGRIALFKYENNFSSTFEETSPSGAEKENYGIFPRETSALSIARLKTSFNVSVPETGEVNRKLLDNEVIQFRAPNFKTIITYPAYVNYYIKLNFDDSKNVKAIPATFQSLAEFFTLNSSETVPNKKYRLDAWTNFVNTQINKNLSTVKYTEYTDLTEYLVKVYRDQNYGGIFTFEDNKYKIYSNTTVPSTGKLYSFSIASNIILWKNWVKTYYEIKPELPFGNLYKQLASDFTRQEGKYIDSSLCKYMVLTQAIGTALNLYFVPKTHTKAETEDGTCTEDGLGKNGEDACVLDANTDYQLTDKEYLFINYTESSTDSETNTTTETVINKYYGPGTIIRPNFALKDSNDKYILGNKFEKTSGYDFRSLTDSTDNVEIARSEYKINSEVNPDGLYTLGTNEQIEIREPVVIKIDGKTDPAYFYFILNDNTPDESDGYIHLFNNTKVSEAEEVEYKYRELQSGEYFFYTDKNKLDIAYYGHGTVIRGYGNIDIKKSISDDTISEQEISENGLDVIPWISYHLTESDYIKLYENQFISLTKDDTLKNITIVNNENLIDSDTWKKVSAAKYKVSTEENDTTLKTFNITIGNEKTLWEVKSVLELNAGPTTKQTLNVDDIVTIIYNDITPTTQKITGSADKKVSFKTNYYAISGSGNLNTTNNLYNSEGILITKDSTESKITDFKVKVFDYTEVLEYQTSSSSGTTLTLNNFSSNNWTKVVIYPTTSEKKFTTLHVNLPDTNTFTLLMFYYIKKSTEDKKGIYFKLSNNVIPEIFNKTNWWDDLLDGQKYYFREGINIIKIPSTCDIDIFSAITTTTTTKSDTLIFSSPSVIIKSAENINGIDLNTLNYFYTGEAEVTIQKRAAELLNDILKVDPNYDFYYNCPIDNSTAIEINSNAEPEEKLSTETIWYDYNNINNKFVVSEIDSNYLSDGITIAKSSKI